MVILLLAVQTLMIGCTGNGSLPFGEGGRGYVPQASDSLYTVERAVDVYAFIAVAALIVALLAIGFAVYCFRQQRILQKKNRIIVRPNSHSTSAPSLFVSGSTSALSSTVRPPSTTSICRRSASVPPSHRAASSPPLPTSSTTAAWSMPRNCSPSVLR